MPLMAGNFTSKIHEREIMKAIKLELKRASQNICLFNYADKVSGIFYINKGGETSVILEGEYVMGKYHCPICALDMLTDLVVQILEAESHSVLSKSIKAKCFTVLMH